MFNVPWLIMVAFCMDSPKRTRVGEVEHGIGSVTFVAFCRGQALLMAMDELERAMLDGRVNPACSSHIFLHVMPELAAVPKQVVEEWKTVSWGFKIEFETSVFVLFQSSLAPGTITPSVDLSVNDWVCA